MTMDEYFDLVRGLIYSALVNFGFNNTKILDEFTFKQYFNLVDQRQIFDISFRGHSAQFEIHRPGIEKYDQKFADKLKVAVYEVIKPTLLTESARTKKRKKSRVEIHRKLKENAWLRIDL